MYLWLQETACSLYSGKNFIPLLFGVNKATYRERNKTTKYKQIKK